MRVTTRTRYAIRALYHLAFHRPGAAAQAKEIAEVQKIPLRFLEQILQDLRRAGLVEARRGPRGGYALARPPAEITLADVLRAVRGPLEELLGVDVDGHGDGSTRRGAASPFDDVPAQVWGEIGGRLIGVLEQATLADFVTRAEAAGVRRTGGPATMYFI
ncbi:MAG TPA: Rrf2 family transcriptional regulator [Polyangia bacterium]|nr:Rrf2 family transcriptional regulator [Polyangia bacterium]